MPDNVIKNVLTVGELIDYIKDMPRDTVIHFENLDYYRLKKRGPKLIQIEFDQVVEIIDEHRAGVRNR